MKLLKSSVIGKVESFAPEDYVWKYNQCFLKLFL